MKVKSRFSLDDLQLSACKVSAALSLILSPMLNAQTLTSALDKLAETYNIAIAYPREITDKFVVGNLPNTIDISQALHTLLEDTRLQFSLSNHGVLVSLKPEVIKNSLGDEQYSPIEEVTVVGTNLKHSTALPASVTDGYQFALEKKRANPRFTDTLFASTMNAYPQQNLAEAIQRMPGLSVERSKGIATTVNLRGLPKNFAHVSINGIATANGNGGRQLDFDMFSPDIVQSVSLNKSPSAIDVEGGIAGNIDISTARPLQQSGDRFRISLEQSHNSISKETDPALSFFGYDTFDNWGALFAYSQSNRTNRTDSNSDIGFRPLSRWLEKSGSTEAQQQSDQAAEVLLRDTGISIKDRLDKDETGRIAFINKVGDRAYLNDQAQWGATLALQYQPLKQMIISFDGLIGNYATQEDIYDAAAYTASSTSTLDRIHEFDNTTLSQHGIVVLTDVSFAETQHELLSKKANKNTDFAQYSLEGVWQNSGAIVTALIGFSSADQQINRSNLKHTAYAPSRSRFTENGGETLPSDAFDTLNMYTDSDRYWFDNYDLEIERNEDSQLTLQLDALHWLNLNTAQWLSSVQFGLRYTDKSKLHQQGLHRITEPNFWTEGKLNLTELPLTSISQLVPGGNYHSANNQSLDWWQVSNTDAERLFKPTDLVISFDKGQFYQIDEEVLNAYLTATLEFDLLNQKQTILSGLRFVDTNVASQGYKPVPNNYGGVDYLANKVLDTGSNSHLLPSINLKSTLSSSAQLKLAYSKTLVRPPLEQLAYRNNVNLAEFKYFQGNPNLKPTYAIQWEAGIEWYMSENSMLSASYFEKNVTGVIRVTEVGIVEDVVKYNSNGTLDGVYDFTVYQHVNAKNDYTIKGIEVIGQLPLSLMSKTLDNFYLNGNYTKLYNELTIESDLNIASYPEGLADDAYNLILYFDNDTLDAHISYSYKGSYVERVERDMYPVYRDDYGQFDISAGYWLTPQIKLSIKAINVTNEVTTGYTMSPKFPIMHESAGRRISAGITISL